MNVAIIGYGKMGKEIEKILVTRGHNISAIIDRYDDTNFNNAEVAIIFTPPEVTYQQIKNCLEKNIKVICGSTGWTKHLDDVKNYCKESDGAFLYSPNFSIGVNLFYKLNDYLNSIMIDHKDFKTSILEKHHAGKEDKPSGTAIKIAEDIIKKSDYNSWTLDKVENNKRLKIRSERKGDEKGHHSVIHTSEHDIIRISHTARSRYGFALGAVISAEFLMTKKGIYGIDDVIFNIKKNYDLD